MFELLDDDPPSPARMPSARRLERGNLNGYLYVVAFAGLILGQHLRALGAAQIVVWVVAVGAGWWFFYRFFRQIETIWRSDPKRRARLLGASVLAVFVLLTSVYLVAIEFELPGWVLLIFIPVDLYLRARRPESP